jgi:hypothetical protein
MNDEQYDVVIAGGGPAGLAIAAELAARARVLLIERRRPGTTYATWCTYMDRVVDHGLERAVVFRSDRLRFESPSCSHDMLDDCVVLDHDVVMRVWIEQARAAGAEIRQASFQGYRRRRDGLDVVTSRGTFTARLLVDAMGCPSPIVDQHRLAKRINAWVLYGARIRLPGNLQRPPRIEYYPLHDAENTYVGIHPFGDQDLNVYVFKGHIGGCGDPLELRQRFESLLARSFPGATTVAPLIGTIPSGMLRRYALDRVIFWGAAGMLNPDGCGMGFNEILRRRRTFCEQIGQVLETDRLDRRSLERVAGNLRDRETVYFQRIIGAFSLHFSKCPARWDGGVRWLNAMGPESRFWMRNEMGLGWIRAATLRLHGVIPLAESVRMIPLRELVFIVGQLARFLLGRGCPGSPEVSTRPPWWWRPVRGTGGRR